MQTLFLIKNKEIVIYLLNLLFQDIYDKGKILFARNKDKVYNVISIAEKDQKAKQPYDKCIVTHNNSYPSFKNYLYLSFITIYPYNSSANLYYSLFLATSS